MAGAPAHMAGPAAEPAKMDTIWERQQIRAFTAWCNSHLRKRDHKIEDIQRDFSDGKALLQLMEVVGDVKLPKAGRGKMRVHAIQNINACLDFIKSKGVRLVGIAAEDIVDENLKLILGTIWTVILRFDIQDISEGEASAKDALLLWCKRKTKGYKDVSVSNFHMSWKDGLAFCALIHRHRPDLLDFDKLDKADAVGNLRLALQVADEHLDIATMIDPEDVAASIKPDERSILTQVAAFYKCFASFNKNEVAASKIATVLKMNKEHEKLIHEYELMASNLLAWIPVAVGQLNERPEDLNSIDACLGHMKSFEPFRTSEYPAKLQEKAVLSAHYSNLQTKLRLTGRSPYEPTEGKLISDIDAAWGSVNAADIANKEWVVSELHRNRLCEQKADVFNKKASNHEDWVVSAKELLEADDFSYANLGSLTAKQKKHEAFKSELDAKKQGVFEVGTLANELDDLKCGDKDAINARYFAIYENWGAIEQLSAAREQNLASAVERQKQLEEVWLEIAVKSSPLNSDLDEFIDRLTAGIFGDTPEDVAREEAALNEIKGAGMQDFDAAYAEYVALVEKARALIPSGRASTPDGQDRGSMVGDQNPFVVHTQEEIVAKYAKVQELIPQRETNIAAEHQKQAARDQLRVAWAEAAAQSVAYIDGLHVQADAINNDQTSALEEQLASLGTVNEEVGAYSLASLETQAAGLAAELIFTNQHSAVTIEQLRGKVQELGLYISTIEASIQNQILTRDSTNITDEQMEEFRASFNHFDKDKSGALDKLEFRGCLLSLGVDIPQVAGENDMEFERIWARIDANGDGHARFGEFVNFMAEERADAATKDDLVAQFQLLSGGQPYILPNQLSELEPDLVAYCVENMAPYDGGPAGALDYLSFAAAAFGEEATV